MDILKNAKGYQADFLLAPTPVPLPDLPPNLQAKVAPVNRTRTNVLKYIHYSVIQHAERKLPILTAANMDGGRFLKIKRSEVFKNGRDRWLKDPRMDRKYQWGHELYSADKSDFDKGHMTKREDVQWGSGIKTAQKAAVSTFFYTNAVPQHKDINRAIWRDIEDYILHDETVAHKLRINSFTGPIFSENDPVFINSVRGEEVKIPTLFWKVIYFSQKEKLFRIAFLVGQDGLLAKHGLVKEKNSKSLSIEEKDILSDFKKADTYQVNVSLIESLSGIRFPFAWEKFQDKRPRRLILKSVNTRSLHTEPAKIQNLVI
ncbi:MAG: DNA/RNA non-specific endonuclease [Bacteroidota bacterium]